MIIMKKRYKITGLDCGHCAARLEEALGKINGVNDAKVNFLTQRVTLEIDDNNIDSICDEVIKVTKKTLPDCELN